MALSLLLLTFSGCQKDKGLDIYLAIGQSNMAGRAAILPDLSSPLEGVYLFTDYLKH